MKLHHGSNLDVLKKFEPDSIDSCVTDPPYGLSAAKNSGKKSVGGFMGKKWDHDVPSVEFWREVLRVMKPGAYLLSFGGTRTYHRMVVNIEDAGFEIRDQLQWIYGSGFPKSLDVSKGIDKKAGLIKSEKGFNVAGQGIGLNPNKKLRSDHPDYKKPTGKTDQAKQWEGFGTALKPANEPIVLARKPLSEKTVVANVLKWGCGGLNIDAGRIGTTDKLRKLNGSFSFQSGLGANEKGKKVEFTSDHKGRWPANTLFDWAAAEMLDEQSGDNVSRFFYIAKASKRERNEGLEGMPVKKGEANQELGPNASHRQANAQERAKGITHVERVQNQNHHPTVKPIKLMESCRSVS